MENLLEMALDYIAQYPILAIFASLIILLFLIYLEYKKNFKKSKTYSPPKSSKTPLVKNRLPLNSSKAEIDEKPS